jgi:2-hydroxychromene-2-carboxylate isomerase
MNLVQLLVPIHDPEGRPFPRAELDRVRAELTERFGGVTAYLRAPAAGLWKDGGEVEKDDVVIVEVMARHLDREWWRLYREELERRFRQEELVVRCIRCDVI